MLQRIAPTLFQGTPGETVTIAAIAHANNGVEAARFRYGTTQLTPRPVQGHPGGEFNVQPGVNTFGALVVFDPSSPNARYELFEEDDSGILQPLQIIARPLSGPIVQFQIAAMPAPVLETAGATRSVAKKAVKKAAKKAAAKTAAKTAKKTAKKTARKAVKKAAKKAGTKKTAKTTVKKTAKKAARKTARKTVAATPRKKARKGAKRGRR